MRGLKPEFLGALASGVLSPFIKYLENDDALDLEIRNNYVNIYYRGGNLFRISAAKNDSGYKVEFDWNYFGKGKNIVPKIEPSNFTEWVERAPFLKAQMDIFFRSKRKLEREYQQLVVRENNSSTIARSTDYFIADIEYANAANGSRFDMLAIKWPKRDRKDGKKASLSFIEVKYGDNALTDKSGIVEHVEDISSFLAKSEYSKNILEEATVLFNQKQELGLLEGVNKPIESPQNGSYEFILLLANHNPDSTVLKNELQTVADSDLRNHLENDLHCKIKIATASMLGYGLYESCMIPLDKFLDAH